jgi:hypothetical protein
MSSVDITYDEFIEKYANVRMTFSSYYKYVFTVDEWFAQIESRLRLGIL